MADGDIHYVFRSDWPPYDRLKRGYDDRAILSEYLDGPEQVALLWEHQKRTYDVEYFMDVDEQEDFQHLLWTLRSLRGRYGRIWFPEPTSLVVAEGDLQFAVGDGSETGFIAPVLPDASGVDFLVDGSQGASYITTSANMLSVDEAMVEDDTGWGEEANCTATANSNYRWQTLPTSLRCYADGLGVMSVQTSSTSRIVVTASQDHAAVVYLRGTCSPNPELGIVWYNAGGSPISTSYGTATAIVTSSWTAVTVEATAPSTAVTALLIVATDGTPASGQEIYLGAAGMNCAKPEWWHPNGCPMAVRFGSAPASDEVVEIMATSAQLCVECRLADDSIEDMIDSMGHVSGKIQLRKIVEAD